MPTSATPSIHHHTSLDSSTFGKLAELAGRILLAAIFLLSGLTKISGYTATAGYMASMGVPGILLPLVIATEVLGAVAIIIGWNTRVAALLVAGFTVLAGIIFHNNFADQTQAIMFLKDIAITGGLLVVAANGAGPLSLDHRRSK
jgi:putative oxidoreductase